MTKADISTYSNFKIKLSRDAEGIPSSFAFFCLSPQISNLVSLNKTDEIDGKTLTESLDLDYEFWFAFLIYTYNKEKTQKQFLHLIKDNKYYRLKAVKTDTDVIMGMISEIDSAAYNANYTIHQDQLLESLDPLLNGPDICVCIAKYENNTYSILAENFQRQSLMNDKLKGNGKTFDKFQHEAILEACDKSMTNLKVVSTVLKVDNTTIKADVTPFFDSFQGRYILLTATDITQEEEHEATIHLFDDFLQGFFFKLNAIILVMDQSTLKILDANPFALDFYGYTKEEFLSMSLHDYNVNPLIYSGDCALTAIPHRLHDGSIRFLDIHPNTLSIAGTPVRVSISFDVTDRVDLTKKLEAERTLLKTTLNSITEGVITLNKDNKIIGTNTAARDILGIDFQKPINVDKLKIRDAKTYQPITIDSFFASGVTESDFSSHYEVKTENTDWLPLSFILSPINAEDSDIGSVVVFRNIQKDLDYIEQMRYLSYHDSLTGLYNRRYLQMMLEDKIDESAYPMALIMADANDLKRINDLYGHQAGDTFLVNIAKVLKSNFKGDAIVSRWGGDEFLIMVPNTTSQHIDSIINSIQKENDINQLSNFPMDHKPDFALGYAIVESKERNLEKYIAVAERYMYREKRISSARFRNRVVDGYLMKLYETRAETRKHSKRLEALCFAMGLRVALTPSQMESLSSLALLHDIGKTKIDIEILDKPGELTEEEWVIMREHPELGYDIAIQYPELSTVAYLILTHHERYDGQGYPLNLKGEYIPIESRILAIVDAFDAMTHDRPYRKAISIDAAIQEIKDNAGTQFDPALVKVFIDIPRSLLENS